MPSRMPLAKLDPQTLLEAYTRGVFPMTDRDGQVRWYTADPRGILPLDQFHIPKSLAQLMRSNNCPFEVRINHDFASTMRACMNTRPDATWISEELVRAYHRLHELGFAHSVETWNQGRLAGGLYGVSIGGAFFGESMFHHDRDASKVALVKLVERLKERGYELLDSQAATSHLRRFGCIELPADDYLQLLDRALRKECVFD
jgi:leucyl/phenylalanyl-tRNA--protein transferase